LAKFRQKKQILDKTGVRPLFFSVFFFFFFFFFIIETLAIFSKKLAKLVEFTVPKTKFAKQIPISLSKIGQISPKKKHWTGNELH
jgi:hypothetical protein